MIVVVGRAYLQEAEGGSLLEGPAARIAAAVAHLGHQAQLVGTAGEDEAGNQLVLALARAGVGHSALLRKAGQRTLLMPASERLLDSPLVDEDEKPASEATSPTPIDAEDVELALRYLPDFSVLVLADPASSETTQVVAQAARWCDARLILVVDAGAADLAGLPDDAIVLEAPDSDPDGDFTLLVATFAASLDDGVEPAVAFRSTIVSAGWAPAETTEDKLSRQRPTARSIRARPPARC